jgi:hypothetical protein
LVVAVKLKLHEAKACGVLVVFVRVVVVVKLKLHEAKACGVLVIFVRAGSSCEVDTPRG